MVVFLPFFLGAGHIHAMGVIIDVVDDDEFLLVPTEPSDIINIAAMSSLLNSKHMLRRACAWAPTW